MLSAHLRIDLESLSDIVVSSMCFWKSSEENADSHNVKECIESRSLELKGMCIALHSLTSKICLS